MFEPITAEQMTAEYRAAISLIAPKKTATDIISDFCAVSGYTREELQSPRRTRDIAHTRQNCMLAIRRNTNLSLPQIGRLFNRDHTTVLFGIQRAKARLEAAK